ncbi:MFS transporter [Celerinatantimonas yamalensis]|uniref:MFS transporter n=1 Tax=Celerinatantimonas yamalensis TaxID=559956 RepID=A0ABW9G2Z8_9GAMM
MRQKLTDILYARKTGNDDARTSDVIDETVNREASANYFKILIAQFLSKSADALMNPKITLPWVMHALGVPIVFLGWLVPIRESGSMLPQLLIANFVRRMPRRHLVWVSGSLLMALCMLGIALTIHVAQGEVAGWAIIGLLCLFSLSRGLNSVAFKDVLGKTVVKSRRGRISGWATCGAGFVMLIIALILTQPVVGHHPMFVYTLAFVTAAICWGIAAWVYQRVIEPPGVVDSERQGSLLTFKRLLLVVNDRTFGVFVLARALMLCSALSAPYFVVFAQQQGKSSMMYLAFFLAASGAAELLSGPFWGWFSDISSRKVMIIASLCSALLTGFMAVSAGGHITALSGYSLFPIVYFLLTIAHQGVRLGRKTYVVNLGQGNRRTDYVSVSNTLMGAILLLTGLLSLLEPYIGISGILTIFAAMGASGALLATRLPEV